MCSSEKLCHLPSDTVSHPRRPENSGMLSVERQKLSNLCVEEYNIKTSCGNVSYSSGSGLLAEYSNERWGILQLAE
jgi:hypothetical protein